jgi:hypothetical protein
MFRRLVWLSAGLAWLTAGSLSADDAVVGQKYGAGVHAYFAGDYTTAYDQLTCAIQGGSKDPRVYYFRGLCYLNLGREPEAIQDFRVGAQQESHDVDKFYNVSKALERVQGSPRVQLETYRVGARMAAFQEAEQLRKDRYEAIQREESRVLRAEPLPPPEPVTASTDKPAEPAADPFAGVDNKPAKPEKKATPPAAAPAAKPPAAKPSAAKPAGKPAGKAASDDPFAPGAAKPAAKPANPAAAAALKKALGK